MYLLFTGSYYYPAGGWNDFSGNFNTLGEALEKISETAKEGFPPDWYHIVHDDKIVEYSSFASN